MRAHRPLRFVEPDHDASPPAGSRAWIGALLIVVVGLGLLYPLWTRREIVYSKHSDIVAEHLSVKAIGRRAILDEGSLPLWNPSMNAGAPALANPQSMYFFPFDLLYLALPLDLATNLVVLLNVLLAGLSMYLLGRCVFKDWRAALFCALAYMLSYRYLAMIHAGWLPKMSMYALAPLLFWACVRLRERPNAPRTTVLAIVVALAFLQGDMQQLYYCGIACLIYVLACLPVVARELRVRVCLYHVIGGVVGVMLAAPVLLPRMQFTSLSTRTAEDYQFFLANPPTVSNLATSLDPDDGAGERNEFWENNFYFGFWLLPLCAVGFRRSWWRAALLLASVVVMAVLCFDTVVLKWLYDHLPGFALFRQSARLLLLAQFVVVVLAGIGVDQLADNARKGKRPVFLIATLAALAVGVTAFLREEATIALVICGLLAAGGVSVAIARIPRIVSIGLLCLLPLLDAAWRTHPLITTAPLDEAFPAHAMHEPLRRDKNPGRVLATSRTVIPYGMAGYFGIDLINGYASLNLKHYIEYLAILQGGTRESIPTHPVLWTDFSRVSKPQMLRALDVRYIVSNLSTPFDELGYERVGDYSGVPVFVFYDGVKKVPVKVWHLEKPLGPAYFAKRVRPVENEDESLDAIAASTSALTAHVLGFDREVKDLDCTGGRVKPMLRNLNRHEYDLDSRGENFLILSQIWYPGWQATLNGRQLKLYRVNHALIGCVVPAGQHHLVLEMTSPPLQLGLMFTAAAALALIALFTVQPRRKKQQQPPQRA